MSRRAETSQPIDNTLAERWSPRAFDPDAVVAAEDLTAMLEAARWTASASNSQPWRFIVTTRGSESFKKVFESLGGFNRDWAGNASVLIVACYDAEFAASKHGKWATYDLGQAMSHLVTQAHALGYFVHQMGGFTPEAISTAFALPESVLPHTVAAIGRLGSVELLNETLRERETAPRQRKSLDEIVLIRD